MNSTTTITNTNAAPMPNRTSPSPSGSTSMRPSIANHHATANSAPVNTSTSR